MARRRQTGRTRCDPGAVSPDRPTCRATIRGATVTLNGWNPALAAFGPLKAGFGHVDAAVADLHREGAELVVVPVRGLPWHARAERGLVAWAEVTGYRRVWLPDRIVDLADAVAAVGRARVTCPTCGARWEDGTVEFWEGVRVHGWFPGSCLACGGSLPEWTVRRAADRRGADRRGFARVDPPGSGGSMQRMDASAPGSGA